MPAATRQGRGFSIDMLQFAWSAVLLLTGSFEVLISYAMFAIWVFLRPDDVRRCHRRVIRKQFRMPGGEGNQQKVVAERHEQKRRIEYARPEQAGAAEPGEESEYGNDDVFEHMALLW
jgi:hypothetical protein